MYVVELTDRAGRDLDLLYVEKNAAESKAALRWLEALEKAVSTLATYPRRCPAAPESRKSRRPLHQLLYGRKPHIYRVIFEIDERRRLIRVLTIRHGAMEPIEEAELNG